MALKKWMQIAEDVLLENGIFTRRGHPNVKLQIPDKPVAILTLENADDKQTVLAVHIFCNISIGGATCEDTAQTAAEALRHAGAMCQVEKCQFDNRSNLFSVKIQATWKEGLAYTVKLEDKVLEYATEFSAVQNRQVSREFDPETNVETVHNDELIWTIAIQEQLPEYFILEDEREEAFTLSVYHNTYMEVFHHCYWLSITLEENEAGILRKRIARSWSNRILENM